MGSITNPSVGSPCPPPSGPMQDDDFFMYRAKIEPCPRTEAHSHASCPYLHPEEGLVRRDPLLFKYDSVFCYDLHNNKVCKRGVNCPYSHNLFEYFLHPSRYRTRMCEYGEKCKRECCFFAHSAGQLRARTAIKTYSGGRRSGKRHRAAQALQAAATGEGGAWGTDASPANSLCFLQVPSLPFADVASTTSGSSNGLLQLDAAAQEGFSRLSLQASTQPVETRPVAVQHVQPQAPSMLLLQDHESACSSAEPLPALGYGMPMMAAGGAPLGMCGPPVCSSMANTLAGCPATSIPGANMHGVSVLQLASAPQALPGILLADSMQGTLVQQQQQVSCFIPCFPPVGAATPTGPGLAMLPAGAAVSAAQYILLPANQVAGGISTATVQALQVQPQQLQLQQAPPAILPAAFGGQHMVLLTNPMQQL